LELNESLVITLCRRTRYRRRHFTFSARAPPRNRPPSPVPGGAGDHFASPAFDPGRQHAVCRWLAVGVYWVERSPTGTGAWSAKECTRRYPPEQFW